MFEHKPTALKVRVEDRTKLPNILLVDGNAPVVRFLTLKLKSSGYDVTVVESLEEAAALKDKLNFHIVALASPQLAGSGEAVARLRRKLACPVLIYGVGWYSNEEKKALGIDHWVDRFYEPEDFIQAVETTLAMKPRCDV
jgi:DNA-binding response OmpR family regulator